MVDDVVWLVAEDIDEPDVTDTLDGVEEIELESVELELLENIRQ